MMKMMKKTTRTKMKMKMGKPQRVARRHQQRRRRVGAM
jgi:hypothetical protein